MTVDVAKSIGFDSIARADARVLILGTLPGKLSLERRQYYAQPRNVFWRIMGDLLGFDRDLPYEQRTSRLVENGIALWDVCAAAHRSGSLDSNIQIPDADVNDFSAFFAMHSRIALVCFNGKPAAEMYARRVLPSLPAGCRDIRLVVLPSTSPAHARMPYEEKLRQWRVAFAF
jgi:hypoxanthine-DNA glycosylase